MSVTVRQAATTLIATAMESTAPSAKRDPSNDRAADADAKLIREATQMDPAHPLLPFARAAMETVETDGQPTNLIRAAWLIDFGMKRLPADSSADDLRTAAHFVAQIAGRPPEQKLVALSLLDRAAKLAPEDDETKALRDSLSEK